MAVTAGPPSLPLWARLAAVPATAGLLVLGLWVFAAIVAPNYSSSIGLGIAWFVVAYVAIRLLGKRYPALKRSAQLTYAAVGIGIAAWVLITTFRDVTVNEQIAGAGGGNVELSRGQFETLAHSSSGSAAIVELADGSRVLTFDDLDTDNGPDLRVYLVVGPVDGDGDVDEFVDLGGLKGNRGDQQYPIPPGVDVARYSTVVIWCRAFSVGFARAELAPS